MRPMRDGERVLIPVYTGRTILGLMRARAYRVRIGYELYWCAYSTIRNAKINVTPVNIPTWWLSDGESALNATAPRGEGITWCRGWSGPTARALRATMALAK